MDIEQISIEKGCINRENNIGFETSLTEATNDLSQHSNVNIEQAPNKANVSDVLSIRNESPRTIGMDTDLNENVNEAIEYNDMHLDTITEESHAVNYENRFFQDELIELGRRLWLSTIEKQHYTKGCLWSPDGTCLLVPVHLDGMHIVELPLDLYQNVSISRERPLSDLKSAVHVPEGGTVYDCVWYPLMNSELPETCFWIATRQHEPIQMWDAFDGHLHCTYSGYDTVDEVETAISLAFSKSGEKIYAGYRKNIKIFSTNRPGRYYETLPVKRAISCIAQMSDNQSGLTCGTWNGYIQHYDLRNPEIGSLFTLGGHKGGITYLRYASDPLDNSAWYLFSGARKDNVIYQWDMRNYTQPVRKFDRVVETNQRIYFDISPHRQWLASGDTAGKLRVWHIASEMPKKMIELPMHADCCNGVSFHPTHPILATSSGQYHFFEPQKSNMFDNAIQPIQCGEGEQIIDYENALLLLWFGDLKQ